MTKTSLGVLALSIALAYAASGSVQAESFNYHGTLETAGQPADGRYDLKLTFYSSERGGNVVAGPVEVAGVAVRDGRFSVPVDLGTSLAGAGETWLAVAVRSGNGGWEALDGRSAVAPAASSCPGSWALDGNADMPPDSFLGTADARDLFIRTNGMNTARFTTSGGAQIGGNDFTAPVGTFSTIASLAWGAEGPYSFAAGYSAMAHNSSSFVWGDYKTPPLKTEDSAPNQFIVGAAGGVGINTSLSDSGGPLADELTVARGGDSGNTSIALKYDSNRAWVLLNILDGFSLAKRENGTVVGNAIIVTANAKAMGVNGALPLSSKPFVVGTDSTNGNGAYVTPGGTWTDASSRFFKEGFATVNPGDILAKLVALPIQTWNYRGSEAEGRHLGPVAEDFADAFGLGADGQHISTVDANGVALVAIQGLNQKLEGENATLRTQLAEMQARLDALASKVELLGARAE